MRGKRSRIRQRVARAAKHGKRLDPHYLAACEGKIRYTKDEAKARSAGISTMKFYKCDYGDHYHVGRKPWKQGRGKK